MSHAFKIFFSLTCLVVGSLSLSGITLAQAPFVLQATFPTESKSYQLYRALGLDGDTAVIGYSGRPEVYTRTDTTWTLQATLSVTPANPFFGENVALDGNTIAVSSRGDGGEAVYVFSRRGTTWTQVQRLTSAFPNNQMFGYRMALDGNTLLVSSFDEFAREDQEGTTILYYVGAVDVFVFDGTQWNFQTRLDPVEDISDFADYGASIEIKGDLVFVASPGLDINTTYTTPEGAVMIFKRSGSIWTQQPTLFSTVSRESFGSSIDFDGTTLLVGALSHPPEQRGAAYFFINNGNGWVQQAKVTGNNEPDTFFGQQVAISGDTALLSPRTGFNGINFGGIHVFKRQGSTWVNEQILQDIDGTPLSSDSQMHLDGKNAMLVYYPYIRIYNFDTVPITNLLINGSFETDADNNFVPDGWSRKNTTRDIRRCNVSNEAPVAYTGNCAYIFKGGTAAGSKLVQNVDLNVHDLNVGDRIRLNGFYNKQSNGDMVVWLFVSYANLPQDQARIKLTRTTTTYQPLPTLAITLKDKPTRVRVEIVNMTTSGKTWFDAMTLTKNSISSPQPFAAPLDLPQADEVIPFPQAESYTN